MKRGRESGDIEKMAMENCLMLLSKVGQIDASKHDRVFACKTCDKRFSSFQALGGHRASHKKPRLADDMPVSPKKPKTHECSICGLEFPMGQALGGHMRRHRAASNDGLINPHYLSPETKKSSATADGGLCLDLKLAPCGIDWDLNLQKAPTPLVHLFI